MKTFAILVDFLDLAGYNECEVVDIWFDYQKVEENVFSAARPYKPYFPRLGALLGGIGKADRETDLDWLGIPLIGVNIIYRKVKDVAFMDTVERSTSVGNLPVYVTGRYKRQ
jgi:hypothetical protein